MVGGQRVAAILRCRTTTGVPTCRGRAGRGPDRPLVEQGRRPLWPWQHRRPAQRRAGRGNMMRSACAMPMTIPPSGPTRSGATQRVRSPKG